jgi:hypothetical protein
MQVKIILEHDETEEEAKELLLKALTPPEAGEEHIQAFHQPAARDVFNTLIHEHDKMWKHMLKEINAVLDEEV